MRHKIFKQCDDIITDYCFDHNLSRKRIAEDIGLSTKQLKNILIGDVDSCFDIIVTLFAKYKGTHTFFEVYETLFSMMCDRVEYITSKNLFTLYELSVITGNKHDYICEYLEKIVQPMKLTKVLKQTIQIIFVIEKMFTFDNINHFAFQAKSMNSEYAKMFQPLESFKINMQFQTFLEYCLNLRRNERIAGYYYEQEAYLESAKIYDLLYQLEAGNDHKRYLGYKLLQSLGKGKAYETLKQRLYDVMYTEEEVSSAYLTWYLENQFYQTAKMSDFLFYWFTRDKAQLIYEFEHSVSPSDLYTTKLLLANLTESNAYII